MSKHGKKSISDTCLSQWKCRSEGEKTEGISLFRSISMVRACVKAVKTAVTDVLRVSEDIVITRAFEENE
jgi:hypothetical protein